MNIIINTKLFEIFQNLTVAHIFNMLLYSQTNTYQQTYIANHLCITRMTVARSLKWLKSEGYIDYTRSKYKEVITTKFELTEKALQIKEELEKEGNEQTIQKEQQEENKENRQTTQIKREQGDAPQGQTPNARNDIKKNIQQPKPIDSERTRFDAIVAARAEYNKTHKFTIV